jgi:hypothetical protein
VLSVDPDFERMYIIGGSAKLLEECEDMPERDDAQNWIKTYLG